jgi:hypothetical protein
MFRNRRQNYFHHGYPGQMAYWNQQAIEQRTQYNHYPNLPQNYGLPYQQQGIFYPPSYQGYGQTPQSGFPQPQNGFPNQTYPQQGSQFLFSNPLQPKENMMQQQYMPVNGYPVMNPYPKQNVIQKQPGGMQSLMNSFKSQDGSVDFNKMMSTAGQMANAVTQVSSLVKGLGGMFKV